MRNCFLLFYKKIINEIFYFNNAENVLSVKLERWIGGIYNHKQKIWTWGETGKPIDFESFYRKPENTMPFSCIIMDPNTKYKWKAKSCFENKHYVCEVPAGGISK